jgi:hypothetical protein
MYIRKDKKLVGMEDNDRYSETFVNHGRVKLASSRSHGRIVDRGSFECKMYITEQEAEFETRQPGNRGLKIG